MGQEWGVSQQKHSVCRFGVFEFDLRNLELRKSGVKLKLQDQPRQVLVQLLEYPGELVSREELRSLLWQENTFVDFETGLNTAVKRLRDTLGDSADNPTFIETIPRRGYTFIAPVEWTPPIAGAKPSRDAVVKSRPWPWQVISVCIFAGLVCLMIVLYLPRRDNIASPRKELAEFNVIPFTALPGEQRSPSFSPDGSQIAFAWNGNPRNTKEEDVDRKFDIYLKVTGSENLVQVTHHPAASISLAWSPDGAQIAFQRLDGSDSGVYLVPSLGGAERRLRLTSARPLGLSWSPDGKWIAFTDSPAVEGSHKLNLISVDSLETKLIPYMTECQEETFPAFSPDGKHLAYFCITQPGRFALYDVDPAGRSPHLIGRYAGWVMGIAWSRDQQKLVVARHVEGITFSELDEITVSDGQLQKLPFGEAAGAPALSPRENKLAFEVWHFTGVNIWRRALNPPGASAEKIIASTQASMFPRYSPDGKQIMFMSMLTGINEIWMSNADGTERVQISKLNNSNTGTPSWSPDGKRVAFDSRRGGHPGVYIADIEERVPHKLRSNIEEMSQPFWSHDGKWIYFIGGASSRSEEHTSELQS